MEWCDNVNSILVSDEEKAGSGFIYHRQYKDQPVCLCAANAPTILANTNSINFIWASLNKFSPIFAQVD